MEKQTIQITNASDVEVGDLARLTLFNNQYVEGLVWRGANAPRSLWVGTHMVVFDNAWYIPSEIRDVTVTRNMDDSTAEHEAVNNIGRQSASEDELLDEFTSWTASFERRTRRAEVALGRKLTKVERTWFYERLTPLYNPDV